MVQVINDPFNGNIAGRIGAGIGKGLSEQVPKEIERSRLASGLKKLGTRAKEESLNPIDIFTEAAGIPGMTPQHLYTFSPLLQSYVQKQNFLNRGEGEEGQVAAAQSGRAPQGSQSRFPEMPVEETTLPGEGSGFVTPRDITDYKQGIRQEPDFNEVNALAKNYLREGITQDPGEASSLAKQELTQSRAAQQQKISNFRTDFGKRLATDLHGSGIGDFKDINGEIQNSLLDQGEYMIGKMGMTPEEASFNLSKIATDLGKTSNKLRDLGSFTNMFRSSKEKTTDLKSLKKDFDKYGYGEFFDDMAAGELGITPMQAAHVLSPLKNDSLKRQITDTPKLKQKSTENNISEKDLDKIIRRITPKDNLFSIEYLLRERGLDINQFKTRLRDLEDKGEIALSPRQQRQMERVVSSSYLGDLLFQTL
jgi:hypothetical protein